MKRTGRSITLGACLGILLIASGTTFAWSQIANDGPSEEGSSTDAGHEHAIVATGNGEEFGVESSWQTPADAGEDAECNTPPPQVSDEIRAYDHATKSVIVASYGELCRQVFAGTPPEEVAEEAGLSISFHVENGAIAFTYREKHLVADENGIEHPQPGAEISSDEALRRFAEAADRLGVAL